MIHELYQHQKNIIAENKLKCGLFLGTGSSKTRTALEMAEGSVLVICPKQQKLDELWLRENKKWDTNKDITVISKETFRRDWQTLPMFDTVIIDECHNNFGVTPEVKQRQGKQYPKASQIFEATYNFLKKNPPKRLYLLSATPVSKPMNLWAIAQLFGQKWNFFQFRQKYYTEVRMGQRRIWLAKKDKATKDKMAELVKIFGYTGSLNDFFDVPEQTHKTVKIELGDEQKAALKELLSTEADPLVRRARQRTIENGVLYGKQVETISAKQDQMTSKTTIFPSKKIDYILERAEEFPKLLIFANYKAQIRQIALALSKEGYRVSELTGETKDRTFIEKVDKSDNPHIIVAQSSISSGYELPSFPCVIYASKSWRYVDYEQSLGRVLRSNHLKKNLYIHLVVDGADSDCHDAILSGQDFQERLSLTPTPDCAYNED
jgi:superfamily II DNA or RNA helicase